MSKAYVIDIDQNTIDSQQSSPVWMLTFIRWENRDTLRMQADGGNPIDLATVPPLVVLSDCFNVTTSQDKNNHTPSMSATLRAGDQNYETSVAPGDFVFVNILASEDTAKIDDLYQRASTGRPINEYGDGFRGVFKVQSVRRTLGVNPQTAAPTMVFVIDGYAFTEFNNSIYFNQYLVNQPEFQKNALYVTNIGVDYRQLTEKGTPNVQDTVEFFISKFIGKGPDKVAVAGTNVTQNTLFYIPQTVGSLLGIDNAKAAKDIYNYFMGIQQFGTTGTPQAGLSPINFRNVKNRFWHTSDPCTGSVVLKAEYFNQTPVWSILGQYLNGPMNEMYNCFKTDPSTGRTMPTFVMRQMPFSTESYTGKGTKFLSLPRWKISPNRIVSFNIGRDEAMRLNFVQVFGVAINATGIAQSYAISEQIKRKNYVADTEDIRRSGLRPYVITSNFDIVSNVTSKNGNYLANTWAKLMGDALIGGHLKMSGTVVITGVQEPIAVGDNLEIDDIVFHIESITHNAAIGPKGSKTFRTTLNLTNGVSKFSTAKHPAYAEMDDSDMDLARADEFAGSKLYLGGTDEQLTPAANRSNGVKRAAGVTAANISFNLNKRKKVASITGSRAPNKTKKNTNENNS